MGRIDTSHADKTITKLAECADLTEEAAHTFRIYAHTVISRGKTAWASCFYNLDNTIHHWDYDELLEERGLVTWGDHDNRGSQKVLLTEAGWAMAARTVTYETRLRRREMDEDEFLAWGRSVRTA